MGIRFHCPNGHKLNVKAFLAGKKGVCPDCGVKLRIPEHSEPGLERGNEEDAEPTPFSQAAVTAALHAETKTPGAAAMMGNATATVTPSQAQPTALATPVRPVTPVAPAAPIMSAPLSAPMTGPMTGPMSPPLAVPMPTPHPAVPYPSPMPAIPVAHQGMRAIGGPGLPMPPPPPPPPPGSSPGMRDPILENPLATWFVRPPSGGQFGPARGEVMRKWITEGRVTSDSLVWREGWADWLAATEVFPSLGKPAPLFASSPTAPKSTSSLPAKKKGGGIGVAILILLALVCVVLVVVLAVVLSGTMSST